MPSKRQAVKLTTLFRSCSVLILRNLTNTWKKRYSVIRAGLTGQDGEEKTNSWEAVGFIYNFGTFAHAPGGCNQTLQLTHAVFSLRIIRFAYFPVVKAAFVETSHFVVITSV